MVYTSLVEKMEYIRDAKLSTLELVKNLVFRGKKVLSDRGFEVDHIHAKEVHADHVFAKSIFMNEQPRFSDSMSQWVQKGLGKDNHVIGQRSFAASGSEMEVRGDHSAIFHGIRTQIEGSYVSVFGGKDNLIQGDSNVVIGASNLLLEGNECLVLGGRENMTCTSHQNVIIRTPQGEVDSDHQYERIILGSKHGTCVSVEPYISGYVHDIPIKAGSTIPRNTIHWSVSQESGNDLPQLVISYKSETGEAYETAIPMTRV